MKIKKNTQTQTKEFRAESTALLHYETKEEWPTVIRTPTLIYPITIQEQSPDDRHPQGYAEVNWNPVETLDWKRYEAGVSYGVHSPFVKQMLNSWATRNRIIPQGWKDIVAAVLEAGPQSQ